MIPEGEPAGSYNTVCSLDFPTFSRYFFTTFINAVVVEAFLDYAHVVFITEIRSELDAGMFRTLLSQDEMTGTDQVLGNIAKSI